MRTDELDYPLPPHLIATHPADPRDSARLLVVRISDESTEHRRVSDLPALLEPNDRLIVNDTSVVRARIIGRRVDSGGRVEGLVLDASPGSPWRVMLRSNGRLRPGVRIELTDHASCTITLIEPVEDGAWLVTPSPTDASWPLLESIGRTPLPPYILRARRDRAEPECPDDDDVDRASYETIYADPSRRRSVAAPTAGLHFTPSLLSDLAATGITRHTVTLHVGTGTFKPVSAETLDAHDMHTEWFEVPDSTIDTLRARTADATTGRTIAVGTTSVRAVESLPAPLPPPGHGFVGETDLLIAPPYRARHIDGLLTNFHLPRSTLIALVAAFIGLDRLRAVYREAVAREYRFYSYGDAMLILP